MPDKEFENIALTLDMVFRIDLLSLDLKRLESFPCQPPKCDRSFRGVVSKSGHGASNQSYIRDMMLGLNFVHCLWKTVICIGYLHIIANYLEE